MSPPDARAHAATSSQSAIASLDAALKRSHRAVLLLVVACGIVAVTQGADSEAAADPRATYAAVGLAVVSVIARRIASLPTAAPPRRLVAGLVGLVAAGAIALVGAWVAWSSLDRETGVLFCLAAGLFALRAPRVSDPRPAARPQPAPPDREPPTR